MVVQHPALSKQTDIVIQLLNLISATSVGMVRGKALKHVMTVLEVTEKDVLLIARLLFQNGPALEETQRLLILAYQYVEMVLFSLQKKNVTMGTQMGLMAVAQLVKYSLVGIAPPLIYLAIVFVQMELLLSIQQKVVMTTIQTIMTDAINIVSSNQVILEILLLQMYAQLLAAMVFELHLKPAMIITLQYLMDVLRLVQLRLLGIVI